MSIETDCFIEEWCHTDWGGTSIPWEATPNIEALIESFLGNCGSDYSINSGIAVHKAAVIEDGVVLKTPIILAKNTFVASNSYLRGIKHLDQICFEDIE